MNLGNTSLRVLTTVLCAVICNPLFAQVPSKAWAQELADRTAARHPELLAVTLQATPAGGSGTTTNGR